MLFDTHAHFNDKRFANDREEVIKHAYDSGVHYMLNVSYDVPSMEQSLSLSRKYPFIYAALGIHPHYSKKMNVEILDKIRKLAADKKVVAIGEIGLDYYRDLSPRDTQKFWFEKQIELAKELKLPVIIHVRDAYEDVLNMVKETNAKQVGGIIHSYLGNLETAKEFLNNNFHISISGPVTYKNSKELWDVIKYVPEDRLLVETDCPYLTPEPFRGKRNDSSFVRLVAEKVADIKGKTLEEMAEITTQNAKRLLKI